jgi:hypothetical protein
LAEYATKSIHTWPSFVCDVGFFADPNLSHNAVRAYFLNPNLEGARENLGKGERDD